ncbi:fibronectin type III domain-containing protein [Chryseobacterium sp. RU33C]|uniref:fibronectin type III domain-containing protein n=1 Tax=Chryseobacterium sp. RU33C TaxID=1907398 RepID=UPI0009574372|nr:fibronectin type III domain-containing protein [Chryseobacterium sp. RU33C]SIQ56633.1 Por secretion system C-terminal sorting domain-containing protein [Chryseobacterium sp. RU33C]
MKKLLLSCLASVSMGVYAQTDVANYTFSKSTGVAYTSITGGTKLFPSGTNTTYDNDVSAAITLSSPFNFGGVAMTTCYVSANGFITFGAAPSGTNYTPLSSLGSTTGAISAFGQDGGFSSSDTTQPAGNHEVRYEDLGTEFVVQWQDHANYFNRSTEKLNFQIRLVYATGEIKIIYGSCTDPGTSTSGSTPQVGIRGNSTTFASNVNSLMIGNVPSGTTCDWSKAVTGNANNSTMVFSSATNASVKIPAGLQYKWTPGTQAPVRTFTAATAITNNAATVNWTAPTGATAYNVQYREVGSCDWTDLVGNPVSAASATISGLTQNTSYQVQVQALNGSVQSIYSHIPNAAGTGNGYASSGSFTTTANCASTVTGLSSSAVTPESATISWTASTTPPGNGYEYYYSTSSTTPLATATPSGSVVAGVTTANISGLTPSTQYYYWVRGNCNGTDKGVWSSSANFTTLGLCPTVTAPASSATGVSVTPTITWNAINGAAGYKLKVGTTSGGNDIVDMDITGGANNSYTFAAPLSFATTYYYSVTAYTANIAGPATACTVRSFQTICNSSNLPYTLDFENVTTPALPICTTVVNSGSGNLWKTATAPTGFTGKVLNYSYNTSNAANTWFFTQGLNLTAGVSYRIKYKYANATGATQYPERVKVAYGSSATSAAMTNIIADHGNIIGGTVTNTFTDFTPGATGVYYIGFQAYSLADMNQIYVDDINIDVTPSCSEPLAVTVSGMTVNAANASWTAPATAPGVGYEYYYSTSSTAPTASTVALGTSTTTSAPLSGLSPSTTYYLWVRSVCSSSDKSAWSIVATFNTLCGTVMAPFVQNFDSGAAPNCWNNINPSATTTDATLFWKFAGSADYGASPANNGKAAGTYAWVDASSPYAGAGVNTVQLVTPSVNLTGLTAPIVSFDWFKNHSTVSTTTVSPSTYDNNKLTVEVNDGNGWVAIFSDNTNLNQWRTVVVPLAASYIGATIQVRFTVDKNVSGNGYYYDDVLLDNVEIKQNPNLATSETAVKENKINVYPNPFTDTLTISDVSKVQSVSIVDVSGRLIKTIEKPSSELQLRDLKEGLYLVVLNMKDGSKQTLKAIKR